MNTKSLGHSIDKPEWLNRGSLHWLLSALRRRRLLFATCLSAFVLASVLVALFKPPVFTATTRLIYEPRTENGPTAPLGPGEINVTPMEVDTQVEVLKSRALLETVVNRLGLEGDQEFNAPRQPSPFDMVSRIFNESANRLREWLSKVGINYSGSEGRIHNEPLDTSSSAPPSLGTLSTVVESLAEHLKVRSRGLSSVVEISVHSEFPAKAANIANAVADAYVASQIEVKELARAQMADWLRSRLDRLAESSENSNLALRRYQESSGLVGLQSSTGATSIQQEIGSLTTELSKARGEEAAARAKLKVALQLKGSSDSFGEALGSPVVQALRRQRNEATARLAQLSQRYGTGHPEAASAQQEIADIDVQTRLEINRVHASLASEARVAETRVLTIQAALQGANELLKRANSASVGETQLQNRAAADQEVYQAFLDRYKQVSAQIGMERPDARIISTASIPRKRDAPGPLLIVFGGILLGCAAGLCLVGIVEYRRGGVYNPEQISTSFRLPWLGSIPELQTTNTSESVRSLHPIDVPSADPVSTFSELVRGTVASEPFNVRAHPHLAVMLTSSVASEGKSTSAVALGRALSLQGARVLLVDSDLHRRGVTRLLGEVPIGIVELVNRQAAVQDVVRSDTASTMHWIGISKGSGVAGTFAKPNARSVLDQLRSQYDILILDSAPVLATADARLLAMQADRIVLAVRWAKTPRAAVRASLKLLREGGIGVSGILLTRVDLRKQESMGDAGPYAFHLQYADYHG